MKELDVSALPAMLQPRGWTPPLEPVAVAADVLAQLGEIGVTREWVYTPIGTVPLKGAFFSLVDTHQERQVRPSWTIWVAILLFPLGLFALLAKDTEYFGSVTVTVQAQGLNFSTQVRVYSLVQINDVINRVNHLRDLAQWAQTN